MEFKAFLWDKAQSLPLDTDFVPATGEWWDQYYSGLVKANRLSEVGLRELTRTSRDIAGLLPRPGDFLRPRPFKGVVVGAVQSGKTQSMMGLAATAMDNGYRVVIVLAGLKDDLRTQTARRFNSDLLLQSDPILGVPGATTLGTPRGSIGKAVAYAPPYYTDCHDFAPLAPSMSKAISSGRPCVVVAKKNPASLSDLGMVMTDLYREFGAENVPTLILDDECDEATVPAGLAEKTIPEAICKLWAFISPTPPVAYVGYTATAAANLLQHPNWVLYPHWTYLLRYPGLVDDAIQFSEASADSWYSGADCYYTDFGDEPTEEENFLVSATISSQDIAAPIPENASLRDALRAYFVSGAYRLALTPDRSFENLENLPEPHSMMIHTSAAQEDHAHWANGIRDLFGGVLDGTATRFDADKLVDVLLTEESEWKRWYDRFFQSRERIYESRPHHGASRQPTWEQVKSKLPEVFSATRLKVVNSDDTGGILDFKPPLGTNGKPLRQPDIYLIAVGGARLSRGITVEGLCISYFARWANTRHDDTILQMSRWFGYRGPYLEFCRLFTTPAAFIGLREVAYNDLQLRNQLAQLMMEQRSPREATLLFYASPYSSPTSKLGVGETMDLTFSPFARVFSTLEVGTQSDQNELMAISLIEEVRRRNFDHVHRAGGEPRGFISRGWSMLEVADVLDRWSFEKHNPSPDQKLLAEHYRPIDRTRMDASSFAPKWDPYQVAAYLRYWHERARSEGLSIPSFSVGVAFGELLSGTQPYDFPLLNRTVTAENEAIGGWTGTSSNWRGDILFDNPPPALLDARKNRLTGACGLLLLYIVHKNATGKTGKGKQRSHHSPFFGISIPSGGPHFIRIATATGGDLVKH